MLPIDAHRRRLAPFMMGAVWLLGLLAAGIAVTAKDGQGLLLSVAVVIACVIATALSLRDRAGFGTRLVNGLALGLSSSVLAWSAGASGLAIVGPAGLGLGVALAGVWGDRRVLLAVAGFLAVASLVDAAIGDAGAIGLLVHLAVIASTTTVLLVQIGLLNDTAAALHVARDEIEKAADAARRLPLATDGVPALANDRSMQINDAVNDFEAAISSTLDAMVFDVESADLTASRVIEMALMAVDQAQKVASSSDQASANVRTVAEAADELATSIDAIHVHVDNTQDVLGRARSNVDASVSRIGELSREASRITEIVGLIQVIASKTNLLALNATIEAARAGEAGRGFAVVAAEVKALAEQTRKAAEEIAALATGIGSSTDAAVASINGFAAIIGEVSTYAEAISQSINEQGSVTSRIADEVAQATRGTGDITAVASTAIAGANETQEGVESMSRAMRNVSASARSLASDIQDFLKRVA
jgi:methyl-accepting chemotaxis protein